jgi:diguanylate cyclase (GGDEF)-like protein
MEADRDRGDRGPKRALPLLSGYLATALGLILILGALIYSDQLRQAEAEFAARANAIYREVDTKLKTNETVLEGVAAFVRVTGIESEEALQAYASSVLSRLPQVHQVGLQRRVTHTELPELVARMQRRGEHDFRVQQFFGSDGRHWKSVADKAAYLVTVASTPRNTAVRPVLGLDVDAVELLREAAARALARNRAAASGLFWIGDGQPAYLLFQPLHAPDDPRYQAALASLLVGASDLLPRQETLPAGLTVLLEHGRAGDDAPRQWVEGGGPSASAVERLLFPHLRVSRVFGSDAQPFVLTVERQLSWSVIDPRMASAFALTAGLGLLMAFSYGRARTRREEEQQYAQQKLYQLANYDSLTGLPNRNLFRDRLQQALSRARRHSSGMALYFLDLDGFKAVNDSAGHEAGDKLLKQVAERLLRTVREQDTVARLSGDEFVVLLEDTDTREDARRVMHQLHESFVEPFTIDDFQFMVTASIGLALYPVDGVDPEQLLRRADHRMYACKHPEWVAPQQTD